MKIPNPTLSLSQKILTLIFEFTKRDKPCPEVEIIKYFNKTKLYTTNCLNFLLELGVIVRMESSSGPQIAIESKIYDKLDGSDIKCKNVISEAIISFQPFVEFCYFIGEGKTKEESAKLVRAIYSVEQTEKATMDIFHSWIKYTGIKPEIKPTRNEMIKQLEESLEDRLRINKFLKQELGSHYSAISICVIEDLATAINNLKISPEQSVVDAGTALEDFLRLDLASNVNLSGCAGIIQITNELNKQPNLFPTKLNNLTMASGNLRSMGKAHGVDKKLLERWKIRPTTAISNIILTISIIKSYLEFQKLNNLEI